MIDTELNKFLKPTLNEIAKLLIKFGFKFFPLVDFFDKYYAHISKILVICKVSRVHERFYFLDGSTNNPPIDI